MNENIILDETDLMFLEEVAPKQLPLMIDVKSHHLKPLEAIIRDEE